MGAQARALNSDLIDPFIRWAGAKRRQRQALLQLSPANFGRYFEPFLGSGALFFALKPRRAVLNDRILPLIETWRSVASHPRQVAEAASSWPVDRETYYQIRALEPEDPIIAAARFIYLNKTCFNGLYRVNAQGKFNVPYGRPESSYITTLPPLTSWNGAPAPCVST
jgi:DNA adenine methylase